MMSLIILMSMFVVIVLGYGEMLRIIVDNFGENAAAFGVFTFIYVFVASYIIKEFIKTTWS